MLTCRHEDALAHGTWWRHSRQPSATCHYTGAAQSSGNLVHHSTFPQGHLTIAPGGPIAFPTNLPTMLLFPWPHRQQRPVLKVPFNPTQPSLSHLLTDFGSFYFWHMSCFTYFFAHYHCLFFIWSAPKAFGLNFNLLDTPSSDGWFSCPDVFHKQAFIISLFSDILLAPCCL